MLQPGRIEGVIGFAALRSVLEAMFGPLEPQPLASQLFGLYTGLAYSAPVLGGLVADRILGERRTVVIGGLFADSTTRARYAASSSRASALVTRAASAWRAPATSTATDWLT